MTSEQVGIVITLIGFVGTCFNVWLTARMKSDMADLKNWALLEFVRRDDMPLWIGPLRNQTQAATSSLRESQH